MHVLHVGAAANPNSLDGVTAMVWQVAVEQARAGHRVTLLVDGDPDATAHDAAAALGVTLASAGSGRFNYDAAIVDALVRDSDLVHLHSVFVLRQAMLARRLAKMGAPYVITPNGGLSPAGLRRGAIKKAIYSLLLERPRFRAAAAVSVVAPGEADDLRKFVPGYGGIVRYIPNPVADNAPADLRWAHRPGEAHVAFLGRFDVLHKGLDLLWDIAARLPHVTFDLYGREDHRTRGWFARLMKKRPKNVLIHEPVFGEQKARVLSEASLYLQPARWEGFPLSVAEAMLLGVPCALARRLNAGRQFAEHDLGPTFGADADDAANAIDSALRDSEKLNHWSVRARQFAVERFDAGRVARQFIELYRDAADLATPTAAPTLVETMS